MLEERKRKEEIFFQGNNNALHSHIYRMWHVEKIAKTFFILYYIHFFFIFSIQNVLLPEAKKKRKRGVGREDTCLSIL